MLIKDTVNFTSREFEIFIIKAKTIYFRSKQERIPFDIYNYVAVMLLEKYYSLNNSSPTENEINILAKRIKKYHKNFDVDYKTR